MSQNEGVKKTINGKTFEMFMLSPMVSHDLLMDVVKMFGPALGPVFDVLFSKGGEKPADALDRELGSDFFSKAAASLFGGLNKAVLRSVIEAFRDVTFVDGGQLTKTFESVFNGEPDLLYKWIAWGFGVQWGKLRSVLDDLAPLRDAAILRRPPQSGSPIGSPGMSGGR